MSPLFGKKCSACGFENSNDAKYCARCGAPLTASSGRKCGVCGTDNRSDAMFCRECGRPLNANENAEIRGNHWARREGDFAARIEISDLPGLLNKNLEVEAGTQALVYANGTPQEILPPGMYRMDSIGKTISHWISGVPKSATVLLVDAAPTEMVVQISNRFTSNPLPLSLSMRLIVEVENVGKFLFAALRGRERYSIEDLRQYLEPEVASAADNYLRQHTLEQLVQNPSTRSEFELAVEEALRVTFQHYGLRLVSLRTVELDLEAYDKIKGIKGKYSLIVEEGEAELNGQKALADLHNQIDLQKLAEDTARVELEEKKVDIYQRMRRTVMADKMNEVNNDRDFEKFMDEIDREKLLSKKEHDELLQGWKEAAEDHDRSRAFLLAKADLEENYQLRAIEIKNNADLTIQEQDYQMEIERKRVDLSLQIEEQKWQFELRKRQAQDDYENKKREADFKWQQTVNDQDWIDAQKAVDLLLYKHRQEQVLSFEKEEHDLKINLDRDRAEVDNQIRLLDSAHRREIEKLEKLGTLGTEALIAASPVEQGRIIQDLKRVEAFKGMSEDQILAMAAEKSPELGKVFEEKYRAIAEGKADQREREMYEKLLAESKSSQGLLVESQRDAMDRIQRMSEHGIDAMKEVSQSYAQQRSDPAVIIAGPNGGSVIHTSHSGMVNSQEETKTCPACGRQVVVSSRFCQYCNNEFKDVK
jgi:hypothetical protein